VYYLVIQNLTEKFGGPPEVTQPTDEPGE